ncbi:ATP-binding protein [Bacillus tuaregi]|uniref:ATP-binding protein n=1 Tax=Bacillus tuaregi TaxID=1816695 RepID=UPI0008F92EF6|nr:ATP-binding protein [Bacillus tuaregi]
MNEILINVLILLVVLLITQHVVEVWPRKITKRYTAIFALIAGLTAIFFCMTFPLPVNQGFIIDIRIVPFIIASLYGGPLTSLALYLFIVFYRFILGFDLGFWGSMINYAIIPLATWIVYQKFRSAKLSQKLIISLLLVLLHLIFSNVIYSYIFISHTELNIILLGAIIKISCVTLCMFTLERIRLNYKIKQRIIDMEKMEILSHLSASISHEIRNGLTGAKGFMQLLQEMENDLEKKRYIHIALEELGRSESIIRDYLTFAKPAPEKVEKIDMEDLIHYSIELISPLTNMNSIEIQKDLTAFWITGERKTIQQAFLNILKNAIEAMPDGGSLTISMIKHHINGEILIQDTGIGMDEDQMERLGKPYFTTKGQKGTGLGMMVAYRVIEEVNGHITVNSQKGQGTTFIISLPILTHH